VDVDKIRLHNFRTPLFTIIAYVRGNRVPSLTNASMVCENKSKCAFAELLRGVNLRLNGYVKI